MLGIEAKIIAALDTAIRTAVTACADPLDAESPNLGYLAGVRQGGVAGLRAARKVVLATLNDENAKDDDL